MNIKETIANNRETVLYLAFGALTTLISWGSYSLFVLLGVDLNTSNILSWVCGVSFAFVTNKWFVFESKSTETSVVATELGSFIMGRIATGVLAIVMFSILVAGGMGGNFMGIDGLPARVITSGVEIVLNWGISKYLVFTKKLPRTAPEGAYGYTPGEYTSKETDDL
ncbi:MAG: GtrA family protein [Methanomassiliicoccaceae archaeon]|nr:GtrA family protein [Methanomassiliicoccaceae archaeon]